MVNNQCLLVQFLIPVSPQLPCGFFAQLFSMRFPYHLGAWNRLWKAGLEKTGCFEGAWNIQKTKEHPRNVWFFLQIFSTCILITKFLWIVEFQKIWSASHQFLLLVTRHVSMMGSDIKTQAFFAQANCTISFWVPTYSHIKWNWNHVIEKNEEYKECVQHAIRSCELKKEN